MRARTLLTLSAALLILAVGGLAPMAGAGDLAVTPETVHRSVDGLATARDAAGDPLTTHQAIPGTHPAPLAEDAQDHDAGDGDQAQAQAQAQDQAQEHDHAEPDGPWIVSEPHTPSIAFSLVGLRLPDGAAAAVRHRRGGQQWSEWHSVHVHPGEGPTDPEAPDGPTQPDPPEGASDDPDAALEVDAEDAGDDPLRDEQGRWHSLPVWTGPADELQLRVAGAEPEDVGVVLVDGLGQNRTLGERASDAVSAVADAVRGSGRPAVASPSQPRIVSRSEWGARASGSPSYASEARAAVLHHTVNGNAYSAAQAPAVVRSIQSYHLDGNGWKDIGYNFLIDRFGTIYEGRAGGITRPVIGAHAGGSNAGSIGVAFMGQHHASLSRPAYAPLPAAAEGSAIDLVSWLFSVHGIDAETATSLPGGTTFPAWSNRILGHGSVSPTSCPGSGVNARLPTIRAGVLAETPEPEPELTVDAPSEGHQLAEGEALELTARLDPAGDWVVTVTDAEAEERHREEGSGTSASISWTPDDDALGALTWAVASPDRPDASGTVWRADPRVERVAGAERTATAAALATRGWPDGADHVVLASAADFPDALTAGPLAATLDAPLLTVSDDGASAAVRTALDELDPDALTVVGGPAAVPEAVVDEAAAAAGVPDDAVARVSGPDRFATAAAVAEEVLGASQAETALIALGAHPERSRAWPDALMAGFHGATSGQPVLLVTPDEVPDPTAAVLADLDAAVVVGGTAAIPDAVAEEVDLLAPLGERLAGEDRFATAVAVTADRQESGLVADTRLWAATGRDFPDGLAAGVAAAAAGEALVLVDGEAAETAAVEGWLERNDARPDEGVVVGGEAAISREAALAHGQRLAPTEDAPTED